MEILFEMLSHTFLLRAFIVGILVSLCASLLGVSLVLKRFSMIGDGLSHVSYGALSIAVVLGFSPLKFSIPLVIIAAFFLLRIAENGKMYNDAAIAVLSASALAIGVVVTSMSSVSTDIESYMFGSILAMSEEDVWISIALSIIVLVLFSFCYHKIFAVTFDESFSKATGVKVNRYHTIIAVLTAVTVVLGMRMMGAMLISALIIFPALSAMQLFKSFRSVIVVSALLSVICFVVGMVISFCYNTPAGASVVLANLFVFILCNVIRAGKTFLAGK